MPTETAGKKVCCLVSELLEETGIDREKVRAVKRQVLQGVMLLCQWQLERMERPPAGAGKDKRARKVTLD